MTSNVVPSTPERNAAVIEHESSGALGLLWVFLLVVVNPFFNHFATWMGWDNVAAVSTCVWLFLTWTCALALRAKPHSADGFIDARKRESVHVSGFYVASMVLWFSVVLVQVLWPIYTR